MFNVDQDNRLFDAMSRWGVGRGVALKKSIKLFVKCSFLIPRAKQHRFILSQGVTASSLKMINITRFLA